jgi:KAP family P-loop domain
MARRCGERNPYRLDEFWGSSKQVIQLGRGITVDFVSKPIGVKGDQLSDEMNNWFRPENRPFVISISGAWGSGKTFWWKNFIQAKNENHIYVSLFGVSTFAELEQRLCSAIAGVEDPAATNRIEKGLSAIGKLAGSASGSLVASAVTAFADYGKAIVVDGLYSRLDKYVIALDDLERRSTSLKVEQILGYASRLRENWSASIVLILNQAELENDDQKLLDKFREKVIDVDYVFLTTPTKAASIGLGALTWAVNPAAQFSERINLSNIRIFQKIRKTLERLDLDVAVLPPDVLNRLVTSVTALCWATYAKGDLIPTPEQLLGHNSLTVALNRSNDKNRSGSTPVEPQNLIEDLLLKLEWYPDGMDFLINTYLAGGFVETESIKNEITNYLADHKNFEASKAHEKYWASYRASLLPNEDRIETEIATAFRGFPENVTLSELASVSEFLREIGKETAADTLVNDQFKFWATQDQKSLERIEQRNHGASEALRNRFMPLLLKANSYASIEEIVEYFEKKPYNGWSPRESNYLASLSKVD